MIVVGLTGSIGMGKSAVAAMCARLRLPVDSADAAVHRLMAPGGKAFGAIRARFPEAVVNGVIDRRRLGALVFAGTGRLAELEAILHPLVGVERRRFIAASRKRGASMVVLDIPLLFERTLEGEVDAIITVSAPSFVQRARVLSRPGMTARRFEHVSAHQMSDREKRRRSDFVLNTGQSRGATLKQLQTVLKKIDLRNARNRPRYRNHRPRPPCGT